MPRQKVVDIETTVSISSVGPSKVKWPELGVVGEADIVLVKK